MELGLSWGGFLVALPHFVLAQVFLRTWLRPYTYGERMVRYLMYLMVLEFIVVHSTALLGAVSTSEFGDLGTGKRLLSLGGLVGFYCLFAGAISLGYRSPWPLVSFLTLTGMKLYPLVFNPPGTAEEASMRAVWVFMTCAYVFGALLTIVLPIPRLGITPEVVDAQRFTASGLWVEQPHRVIAFGTLYFAALGVYELLALG